MAVLELGPSLLMELAGDLSGLPLLTGAEDKPPGPERRCLRVISPRLSFSSSLVPGLQFLSQDPIFSAVESVVRCQILRKRLLIPSSKGQCPPVCSMWPSLTSE